MNIEESYRRRRRERCFTLLGGARCVHHPRNFGCEITDRRVLQFDHKEPPKKARNTGVRLFREIESHPERFQVLCSNCNWIKRYENSEAVGGKFDEEHRQKISQAAKRSWRNPVTRRRMLAGLRASMTTERKADIRDHPTRKRWSKKEGDKGRQSRWSQPGAGKRHANAIRAAAARGAYKRNGGASL